MMNDMCLRINGIGDAFAFSRRMLGGRYSRYPRRCHWAESYIGLSGRINEQVPDKLGKDIDEMLEKLGKRAERLGKRLGKNRIAILKMMYENPFVSTIEMSSHIGISTTAIDNNIRQMRGIFIKHIGPKNGGHWEIITEDDV